MSVIANASAPVTNDPPLERQARMPRFGVAILDNPKDFSVSGGWASLAGKEAFLFRQLSDLPNDAIWITTVDEFDFNSLKRMNNLRPSNFLRTKLHNLAADLGMAFEGEDFARPAAKALSEVANRAALIAAQVYQWEEPTQRLLTDNLSEDIRKCIVRPPPTARQMRGPLLSAYQNYSAPERGNSYEPNSTMITLRLNRLAYAKQILSTPVPSGTWSYTGIEETSNFNYPLEVALDPNHPCLVEATVETSQSDPEISVLAAFGAQPGRRSSLRSWISQPELQWLHQHAKIRISRAYYTHESSPLVERLQLPEALVADELWELSLAAGLVAECHWGSIVNPVYNSQSPSKKDVSVWGVWLRAADRAMCFALALKAHKAGYFVKGYGNGSVVVTVARPRLHALLDFAMENNVAHPAFREVFERNGLT